MQDELPIRPGLVVPGEALEVRTSRSSGPGGQHVNKTETRVSLELHLERLAGTWSEFHLERVRGQLSPRLTNDGRLIVHADASRSQSTNLEEARQRMAGLVRGALHVPKTRRETRPSKGAVRRRLADKKKQSEKKKMRGKPSFD